MRRITALIGVALATCLITGCNKPASTSPALPVPVTELPVLNLYWWSDFIAPNTIAKFEKQSGIKVNISYYDFEETLEARVLAGHSGFDVVDPAAPYFFQRQLHSGAYLALDKKKLSNLRNLDPRIMSRIGCWRFPRTRRIRRMHIGSSIT